MRTPLHPLPVESRVLLLQECSQRIQCGGAMPRIPLKAHLPFFISASEWAALADNIPYSSQILSCEDARAHQPRHPNRASVAPNLMAHSVEFEISHVEPGSNSQSAPAKSMPRVKGDTASYLRANRAGGLR
jgi:hypothetical protein